MGTKRDSPTKAPPVYRLVTKFYRKDLRSVVVAMSLVTAIWALAWTVSSFKQLKLVDGDNLPRLALMAKVQGALYATACVFQTYGVIAGVLKRFTLIKINAFLCALSTTIVIGVGILRVLTHYSYKSDLIVECTGIAQTGVIGSVFGIWGSNPPTYLNQDQAASFCNDEWGRDSLAELVSLILSSVFGLMFTAIAFAHYRQKLDPTSSANSSRLPYNQARGNSYPTSYNPPYDETGYAPVYLPPPGPPPANSNSKLPEYKQGSYLSLGDPKDPREDDPFSDYDGPSIPMPTHWVEDRDVASPPRV